MIQPPTPEATNETAEALKRELYRFQCSAHTQAEIERFIDHIAFLAAPRPQIEPVADMDAAIAKVFSKRNAGEISAYLSGVLDGSQRMPGELMHCVSQVNWDDIAALARAVVDMSKRLIGASKLDYTAAIQLAERILAEAEPVTLRDSGMEPI